MDLISVAELNAMSVEDVIKALLDAQNNPEWKSPFLEGFGPTDSSKVQLTKKQIKYLKKLQKEYQSKSKNIPTSKDDGSR